MSKIVALATMATLTSLTPGTSWSGSGAAFVTQQAFIVSYSSSAPIKLKSTSGRLTGDHIRVARSWSAFVQEISAEFKDFTTEESADRLRFLTKRGRLLRKIY